MELSGPYATWYLLHHIITAENLIHSRIVTRGSLIWGLKLPAGTAGLMGGLRPALDCIRTTGGIRWWHGCLLVVPSYIGILPHKGQK